MAISTRFSVAVHILTLIDMNKERSITSDTIAASVNTNPVVIRRIMSKLKKAGLIQSSPGISGTYLLKNATEITLYDIYQAVEVTDNLFDIHKNPNPNCEVGANIQETLDTVFIHAQQKMEADLKRTTLSQITADIKQKAIN
ncbi:Rrf2 family transcriptional regulator [Listeria welshimeri]|uniref:Rrf2 family transcriptional regulator n=2 Tax=Listeria welshimeri TaxID=1643 RepID=A0ABX4IH58_LISWE|nr:Rrf2 family transcriptional regulator [Listeria welshimeri]MBC1243216.1 Rrf2 family transcriptional regulator [Listeria welshimeri]MBC1249446.1 Rrf2 family transcriptional regulator [Listeria welshimeri]MBC1251698.1 Rrf2 family transcriptional regulator [Listeria welshimeri]MBC1340588.1 Rrf2 family transcriptional regulator [Listeria welshimeri]MBC1344322.1 Rrf2 family transcriptional regulator [Listeria welshimeri]